LNQGGGRFGSQRGKEELFSHGGSKRSKCEVRGKRSGKNSVQLQKNSGLKKRASSKKD